jgi:cell division protein FtsB
MKEFFDIIANFGFPVAVASYLLFRFEKKLEQLEKTNEELVTEVKALKEKVAELEETILTLRRKK